MSTYSAGKVSVTPRGPYSASTEYERLDVVTGNGNSYMYINKTPATGVGLNMATHWLEIAQKGDTGLQGLQGVQGEKGDTGLTGPAGPVGDTGPQGPQGAKGDPGLPGQDGKDGGGVPAGGTTGQVLSKVDNTDHNVAWADQTGGGGGGKNILHNWDFRNPVNQRGLSTTSRDGYWLDRWTLGGMAGATYTYSSSWGLRGITTTSDAIVRQYIENPNAYAGKTVTVSVDIYSASVTASCTVRLWHNGSNPVGSFDIANGDAGIKSFTATIPNTELTNLSVAFYNYAGNDVRIKSIKLELGTVSTLHLDPPMDHAVELLKCQRFFRIRSTNNVPSVDLSPTMRITPTITGSGPYQYSADL